MVVANIKVFSLHLLLRKTENHTLKDLNQWQADIRTECNIFLLKNTTNQQ